MTGRDEVRDQIESALRRGGVFTHNQVANVMAIVDPILAERDEARDDLTRAIERGDRNHQESLRAIGALESARRQMQRLEVQRDEWKAVFGVESGDIDTTPGEKAAELEQLRAAATKFDERLSDIQEEHRKALASCDRTAVQAGTDVKVMLTLRLAEALGDDSAIVDFDDLCDRVRALAAPSPPVDRETLAEIIERVEYGAGGWVSRTSREQATGIADALISAGVGAQPPTLCEKCRRFSVWRPDRPGHYTGHFCAKCCTECHDMSDESSVHMCVIDRWQPAARDSSRGAGQPAPADAYVCKCPGSGTHAHVRGCHQHPEAGQP